MNIFYGLSLMLFFLILIVSVMYKDKKIIEYEKQIIVLQAENRMLKMMLDVK